MSIFMVQVYRVNGLKSTEKFKGHFGPGAFVGFRERLGLDGEIVERSTAARFEFDETLVADGIHGVVPVENRIALHAAALSHYPLNPLFQHSHHSLDTVDFPCDFVQGFVVPVLVERFALLAIDYA
jgi:hypothetical protein